MAWYNPFSWRQSKPKQIGTIFIKPSEKEIVKAPKGITISVPETGETKTYSSGGYTQTSTPVSSPSQIISSGGITSEDIVVSPEVQKSLSVSSIEPISRPSMISLPSDVDRGEYVQLSQWEAGVGTFKNILSRFGSPTKRRSDDLLAPFDLTKKPKYAETAYQEPQFGTKVEGIGAFRDVTYGDLQKDIEIKRGVEISGAEQAFETVIGGRQEVLQKKVYAGEMEVSEAQELLDVDIVGSNIAFQEKQKQIYGEMPDVSGLYERGIPLARHAVDIGMLSNPLTAFIGAKVSMMDDPYTLDEGGMIVQKPSLRTHIFIGGGVIGGAGKVVRAGKMATEVRIESALEQFGTKGAKYKGVQIKGKDIVGDISFSKARVEGGAGISSRVSIIEKAGAKSKFKLTGYQEDLVIAKEFFTDKPIVYHELKAFTGGGGTIPIVKDLTFGSGKVLSAPIKQTIMYQTPKGMKAEITTMFKPKDVQTDFFAGLSIKKKDLIYSVGGKPTAEFDIVYGKGFKAAKPLKVSFDAESYGITKILGRKPKKDIMSYGMKGFTETKTSLAKTFAPQISIKPSSVKLHKPKTDIISGIGGIGTGLKQPRDIVTGKVVSDVGVYPKLKPRVKTKVKTDIVSGVKGLGGIRTSGFQGMFQPVISKEKLKEFQIVTPIQRSALKQKQVQKSLIGELGDPFITSPRQARIDFGRGFFFPPFALPLLPIVEKKKGKRPKSKRRLTRTPSLGAVMKFDFGFEQPKFAESLEETGLFERKYIKKKKKGKKK